MQKLDLLSHLLSNLTQALVVCGPKGIGKTTLLSVLQERNTKSWRYCLIQANADLSFEAVLQQFTQALVSPSGQSLSMVLAQYRGGHKQVVLIIDNAGELVPGLMTAIMQYAAANPVLRVIFALTHDELQVKRGSDRVVDDCHIIEIPTLSEQQCGDFLRHLSTKPALNLSFQAISENMIASIYRETHGVPGRVIAEISAASGAKQVGKMKWMLPVVIVAAGAIAVGAQWLALSNSKEAITVVVAEQTAEDSKIPPLQTGSPIMDMLPSAEPVIQSPENEENTEEPSVNPNAGLQEDVILSSVQPKLPAASPEQPQQVQSSKMPASAEPFMRHNLETIDLPTRPVVVAAVLEPQVSEMLTPPQLASEQSSAPLAHHFTLQLMVLSKQDSINSMIKKYPAMTSGFRTIELVTNGKQRFVVEYGSYPDAASANKAKRLLPAEFRNALVRKMSPIKHR